MKIWSDTHIFEHPWETVVEAVWQKYPNPLNPNVDGLDTVDRKVDTQGKLLTHRLMITKWGMPGWVAKIVGMPEHCYISEHSEVDPKGKQMTLKSRNLTLSKFITVDEHLVYKQHPEKPAETLLTQETVVSIQGVPMTDYLEGVVFGNISNNAHKGRQAIECVISKVKDEAKDLARSANETMRDMENHFVKPSSSAL